MDRSLPYQSILLRKFTDVLAQLKIQLRIYCLTDGYYLVELEKGGTIKNKGIGWRDADGLGKTVNAAIAGLARKLAKSPEVKIRKFNGTEQTLIFPKFV